MKRTTQMKINIARSSGFCFGVRRAINLCESLAGGDRPVYVLGDIVHNSFVVEKLSGLGIRKMTSIAPGERSILIIRAHGAPKKTFDKARASGYKVVDATCPKVKDIYAIARRLEKKHPIIIIGDKGHDEVKGIAGQLVKRPLVIGSPSDIIPSRLGRFRNAAVITQSTQSSENIMEIMAKLKNIVPGIKLHDTTCKTTVVKQQEIRTLPRENDVVLILGSPTSANTKRLYQISRSMNKKTHWIGSAAELKKNWFKGARSCGIMAGASTPDEVTKGVVEELSKITGS